MQDKRINVVKVRYNDEEFERLKTAGEMPVAKYIRLKSLENPLARRIHPPKVEPALMRELNAIGINLNQLTKIANSEFNHNFLNALALSSELAVIRQGLEALYKKYQAGDGLTKKIN